MSRVVPPNFRRPNWRHARDLQTTTPCRSCQVMRVITRLLVCSLLLPCCARSFHPQHWLLMAVSPHHLLLRSWDRLASAPALPRSTTNSPNDSPVESPVEIVIESKPVLVAPEAINMLCHLLIAHHRDGIVRFINSVACSSFTVDSINQAAGNLLVVTGIAFNITGPVQPELYFRCSDFKLSRAVVRGSEVLHADFAVEYLNRVSLAVDVQSVESPAYRVISPRAKPVRAIVWGRVEGATIVRLTLQAHDSYILRPAHVAVTDASALHIRLDDYAIQSDFGFAGTFPGALRLIPGRLPLRRLEALANNALTYALSGRQVRGWDVCGGVMQASQGRTALPAAPR